VRIVYFITQTHQHGLVLGELHRKNLAFNAHRPDALVNGVARLQLRFVTQTPEGLVYRRTAHMGSQETLQGVQVNLLVSSHRSVYQTPHCYHFLGHRYQASDGKLYRQWSFYVSLRNR
jgi:hypothetical protein